MRIQVLVSADPRRFPLHFAKRYGAPDAFCTPFSAGLFVQSAPSELFMLIVNAQLVLPDAVSPGALRLENGRIASLITGKARSAGELKTNINGGYLAPGFIDLHVHGALGHDAMEATRDAFAIITRFHLE